MYLGMHVEHPEQNSRPATAANTIVFFNKVVIQHNHSIGISGILTLHRPNGKVKSDPTGSASRSD